MAEAVVHLPLFRIGNDRVRFGGFFEFLFSGVVAGVAIRVIFQRQLAVGAFHFRIGRAALDAENFVVVALAHDAFATFTMAGRSRRSPIE